MPTADRAAFVPQAIACFLAQDFDPRELLVVDNGNESIQHLLPPDPRIRYERVSSALKLGELRNRACEHARGEIIVHWDDDDWYPPNRISRQVAQLEQGGAELCATSRVYFLASDGARAWEYCSGGARPWLAGSSFAYRRTLWQRNKFQSIRMGEDGCFAAAVPANLIVDLADPSLVIASVHARNTSPKRPSGAAWTPADVHRVLALKSAPGDGDGARVAPASGAARAATAQASRRICVGVYVRSDAARLAATLRHLRDHTPSPIDLVILADGVDVGTRDFLDPTQGLDVSASQVALGASAAFNRLLSEHCAEIYVFVESGSLVGPQWLALLCSALDARPEHGLAGPTTNMAWSVQGEFRNRNATEGNVALLSREAAARFGDSWQSLAPLYCLSDFCFAVKREVAEAIGGADQAYGVGPCWEMDYAARAVCAGFGVVWARGAYVFRHRFTAQRERDERAWMASNKARYQRKLCGKLLSGEREDVADHCRGEACPDFAPSNLVALRLPLDAAPRPPSTIPVARAPVAVETEPLVSCIMPTHGRPEWVLQSIRYFQRQSYRRRELIIIDTSKEPIDAALPCDPRIRYVYRNQRMTIGAMRNLACEMARGRCVAHWDDDDWYGPERLAVQLAPILAGGADITALTGTPFLDLRRGEFWKCTAELFARMFVHAVHGGTLVYDKRLFGVPVRFPSVSIAEDAAFLRAAVTRGARLLPIDAEDHFVYVRHGQNAWCFACGEALDAKGWTRIADLPQLGNDLSFYRTRGLPCRQSV